MLQQEFSNFSGSPDMYTEYMNNMYSYGSGYFGINGNNSFSGWRAYKSGGGWTFPLKETINYNLIFKC